MLKAALSGIADRYRESSGTTRSFAFIDNLGFAEVVPGSGRRVRRALQEELREASDTLRSIEAMLKPIAAGNPDAMDRAYGSIQMRTLLKASHTAYYDVSHRMMTDLLFVSPKKFTIVASLYNDMTNFHKLLNEVRYGERSREDTDAAIRKLAGRIAAKSPRVRGAFSEYEGASAGRADDELFGEHNIMAYRYRNTFYVNVELMLAYLGIDPEQDKRSVARQVAGREEDVIALLDVVERNDAGSGSSGRQRFGEIWDQLLSV